MRWTTVCDLRFREYGPGVALDSSRFLNHATIDGGVTTHDGYVTLTDLDSQLVLKITGASLQRFGGLDIFAEVRPSPVGRRQNVVEGWMSFACFIQPDGQPVATIFDGQNWVPVSGSPGDVPFNEWSQLSVQYDGISAAVIAIDGQQVGTYTHMPLGMRQPHQNITIGHWPSGDGRYTYAGDIRRVVLRRRDYEDVARDAVDAMLCSRLLTEHQMGAVAELRQQLALLPPEVVDHLRQCARARYEAVTSLIRDLRDADPEALAALTRWNRRLLKAWCCRPDVLEIRRLTDDLVASLGRTQRERFKRFLDELAKADAPCDWDQSPLDRLRTLLYAAVPELVSLNAHATQVATAL